MSPRRLRTWIISAGTEEVVVAASSQREAVERLQATQRNWSLYSFRQYASDLRDDHPLAVMALAKPGVVFSRSNRWMGRGEFVEEDPR